VKLVNNKFDFDRLKNYQRVTFIYEVTYTVTHVTHVCNKIKLNNLCKLHFLEKFIFWRKNHFLVNFLGHFPLRKLSIKNLLVDQNQYFRLPDPLISRL
jgi:hypothetical protein